MKSILTTQFFGRDSPRGPARAVWQMMKKGDRRGGGKECCDKPCPKKDKKGKMKLEACYGASVSTLMPFFAFRRGKRIRPKRTCGQLSERCARRRHRRKIGPVLRRSRFMGRAEVAPVGTRIRNRYETNTTDYPADAFRRRGIRPEGRRHSHGRRRRHRGIVRAVLTLTPSPVTTIYGNHLRVAAITNRTSAGSKLKPGVQIETVVKGRPRRCAPRRRAIR